MKAFDKSDWNAFAGAEANDDHPAFINDKDIEAYIIADMNGVSVGYSAEDESEVDFAFCLQVPYGVGRILAAELEKGMEGLHHSAIFEWMQKLEFTKII